MLSALVNGKIIYNDTVLEGKAILFSEKIVEITDNVEKYGKIKVYNAKGNFISAGFIDIHTHGFAGKDVMDGNHESLKVISKGIVQNGVTSFLPTTMTMEMYKIEEALKAIKIGMNMKMLGANIIGAHLEGPFIHPEYKGAQQAESISDLDFEFVKKYEDVIRYITYAPEKDGNLTFTKKMRNLKKIYLSIGHSGATYDEAMKAIEYGVKSATHTFNAMKGMHHREPGTVGAVMDSDVYAEVIVDNIHLHPAMVRIITKIKGLDKIILVTDSMRAACMKPGIYELGGQTVEIKDHTARLKDGTLAGSILNMNDALRNYKNISRLNIVDVVKMATENPARLMEIFDQKGSLNEGKDADITVFDENFHIKFTFVHGQLVHKGEC
ncbi:N-acetylglucosamine-6-phosphate deacetylase [Crassaminicella profunda]|uniref:N-acetylglucosamine-6-phosphate deacetylase n=1 Tax=Crassaminicella profunda TaxID=1286698 RepID=UPI001FED25DC|nr:N-acetylglucosamine-6-phosphate deacetylase [Crassaminicella profunda]